MYFVLPQEVLHMYRVSNQFLKYSTSLKDGRSFGTELSMRFSAVFPEPDDEIAVEQRVFERNTTS